MEQKSVYGALLSLGLIVGAGCGASSNSYTYNLGTNNPGTNQPAGPVGKAPLSDVNNPVPGLFTGGQPSKTTLEYLADRNVRTVVNLRPVDEPGFVKDEPAIVQSLGMTYVSLPVAGLEAVSPKKAKAFAEVLEEAQRPVFVHSRSGDRVGALIALKSHVVDGRSIDEAMTLGENAGMVNERFQEIVRDRLSKVVEAGQNTRRRAESQNPGGKQR